MKKVITPEVLEKIITLQKEGLSTSTIAFRFGVHSSTITQALYKASLAKTNKYGAKKTGDFPSGLEYAVYQLLLLREKAKEITDIKRQVRVELTKAGIATKIDFSFTELRTGKTVYCEAKGVETERWKMIKKLWEHYGPSDLEVFTGNHSRPQLTEVIIPKLTAGSSE